MPKKESIFKRLKIISIQNPAIAVAIAWVTLLPATGSLLGIQVLYRHSHFIDSMVTDSYFWTGYTLLATFLMGLAFLPTTLLAIFSGYLWGWAAFPFLVSAYSLASVVGYLMGKKLDKGSLQILLENYPKAAELIRVKQTKMGQLIFFVRLSPVIPFALSNLLFALLKAGWHRVILFGLFGMLPRTLLAFSSGLLAESLVDAFENKNGTVQVLAILTLLLLSLFGIYRFFKPSPKKAVV